MYINKSKYKVFCYATDHHPELANKALRSAFLVEQEILDNPDFFSGTLSIQEFLDHYNISRNVGHEALRILQHRKVIETKRGPNGGLQVILQSDENLKASVTRYLLQKKFRLQHCSQARESLISIASYLSPENPINDLLEITLELVGYIENSFNEKIESNISALSQSRADQIANKILINSHIFNPEINHSRLGHENELSEYYQVSKPVIRQAIRILEAESIIETRRGRSCGIYLTRPMPGPVSRLLALWLLGRKTTLAQIFEFEHPLRVAINMQASTKILNDSTRRELLELQKNMELRGKVKLIDIMDMERQITSLADNPLLDLLLKSMTVYKISRAHYHENIVNHSYQYVSLNKQVLQGLLKHSDAQIENYCQEKNHYLKNYDLESMHTFSVNP